MSEANKITGRPGGIVEGILSVSREAIDAERERCAKLLEHKAANWPNMDWRPIETAPKDGTHILAVIHREAIADIDGVRRKAFSELREIWWKDYMQFGMFLPWHAGDPFDSHDGMAPEHMGCDVPVLWMPKPPIPKPFN